MPPRPPPVVTPSPNRRLSVRPSVAENVGNIAENVGQFIGEVVDEVALAQALQTGTLGGAGLDVFDGEPNIKPETREAPNMVMLPHLGSATSETRVEMGMRVVENLNAIMAGTAPRDPVG